jgi:hypothetical protein
MIRITCNKPGEKVLFTRELKNKNINYGRGAIFDAWGTIFDTFTIARDRDIFLFKMTYGSVSDFKQMCRTNHERE